MVVHIIIEDLDWSRIGMNAHSSRHQTWGRGRFDGAFSTPHSSRDGMQCVHPWRTERAMKAHSGRPRFLVWKGYNAYHSLYLFYTGCIAIGYLQWYTEVTADKSPDGDRMIMPVGMSIRDIFDLYVRTCETECLNKSQFYGIWKTHFSHVTFPKVIIVYIIFCKYYAILHWKGSYFIINGLKCGYWKHITSVSALLQHAPVIWPIWLTALMSIAMETWDIPLASEQMPPCGVRVFHCTGKGGGGALRDL